MYKLISCFFLDIKKDARRILIDTISIIFDAISRAASSASANRDGNLSIILKSLPKSSSSSYVLEIRSKKVVCKLLVK